MKNKSNFGMVFSLIFLFVLVLMLIFGHWQLNRQANELDEVQEAVVENSQMSTAVVNFINAQLTEAQP